MTAISRRKIISQKSGGLDPALDNRVTTLENNEYKILYFETISTATGSITKPTNSTILLDQFYSGGDAIVETLSNGQPTGQSPLTVGGSVVSVSSFDTSGNYTLSGTPSSFDVALVYIFKIKAIDYPNIDISKEMKMEDNLWIEQNLNTKLSQQVIQITSSTAPIVSTTGYNKTFFDITALAGNINLSTNLSGSPKNGDVLWFQIKDNGTARVITCGSLFEAKGEALPTTTVISKRINIGATWDSTTGKWGVIAVSQEI